MACSKCAGSGPTLNSSTFFLDALKKSDHGQNHLNMIKIFVPRAVFHDKHTATIISLLF